MSQTATASAWRARAKTQSCRVPVLSALNELECSNICQQESALMRMFVGMILGSALTLGGLYVADKTTSGEQARPMVNWDVMAKNVDAAVALAKEGWKKIAG
jgi:hypothetical protein